MSTVNISTSILKHMKFSQLCEVAKNQPTIFKDFLYRFANKQQHFVENKKLFIRIQLAQLCADLNNDNNAEALKTHFHALTTFFDPFDLDSWNSFFEKFLTKAMDKNQGTLIKRLIEIDPCIAVFQSAKNLRTILHYACEKGLLDLVELLIKKGVSLNPRDNIGLTPLHLATREGHKEIVQLLIDNKADANAVNIEGQLPLHMAAQCGHEDVVELLLNYNSINITQEGKLDTPLNLAAQSGHVEVVKVLLKHNADIEIANFKTESPLASAINTGHLEITELLIKKCDTYSLDRALFIAVQANQSKIVAFLLDNHANIESKNSSGETPLHKATQQGYLEIVELLLERKANIIAKDNNHETPLHIAAFLRQEEIVKLLLKYKANIEAENNTLQTPLHLATTKGHAEIILLLLENGANIEASDTHQHTPLFLAAHSNRIESAACLIKRGANLNAGTDIDGTPLHMALTCQHVNMAKLLIREGTDLEIGNGFHQRPIQLVFSYGNVDVLRTILEVKNEKNPLAWFESEECKECVSIAHNAGTLLDFLEKSEFAAQLEKWIPCDAISEGEKQQYLHHLTPAQIRKTLKCITADPSKKDEHLSQLIEYGQKNGNTKLELLHSLLCKLDSQYLKHIDWKQSPLSAIAQDNIIYVIKQLKNIPYPSLAVAIFELGYYDFLRVFNEKQLRATIPILDRKTIVHFLISNIKKLNHPEFLIAAETNQKMVYLKKADLIFDEIKSLNKINEEKDPVKKQRLLNEFSRHLNANNRFLDRLEPLFLIDLPDSFVNEKIGAARKRIAEITAEVNAAAQVKSSGKEEELSDDYNCRIMLSIAADPVIDKNGYVYDRKRIKEWLDATGKDPKRAELKWEDEIGEEDKTKYNYLKSTCYLLAPFKTNQPLSKEETEKLILRNLEDLDSIERTLLDEGADPELVDLKIEETQQELKKIAENAGIIPDNKNLNEYFNNIG